MKLGWSFFIIAFTIGNIIAALWLLWWTAKKKPEDKNAHATTGHVWDGDLQEYNKPLPRWWLNLFYITIVFGLAYLWFFPGLGSFRGSLGWSSEGEHSQASAEASGKLAPTLTKFSSMPFPALMQDSQARALGRSIFASNCTTCHGSDAKGAKGYPNLVDEDWLWGGDPETVLTTISAGRKAAMPAWEQVLGEQGAIEAAVYIQSLSEQAVDQTLAQAGQKHYQNLCVACHGQEGKGNPAMGAPNLTDRIWLYGGDFDTIVQSIRNGRNGEMPAHGPILGQDKVKLVAAYVLSQSAKGDNPTSESNPP